MNKEEGWTLKDVDSEDENEIDDNTSLKLSSLTSSPFPQYDELNIDISNIEATPNNEKIDTTVKNDDKYIEKEPQEELLLPNVFRVTDEVERMRRRQLLDNYQKRIQEDVSKREPIDKNEYLSNKIENILNNELFINGTAYTNLLKKLIDKNYTISENVLNKMKTYDWTNINYDVIEEILNYYNNKTGGKRYTRKTKKSSKRTKKFLGNFHKHKKSRKTRKSRKFPRKFQRRTKK